MRGRSGSTKEEVGEVDCFQSAVFHVLFSASLSILAGILITLLAFLAAYWQQSMSLYALSLMALIDTCTSVLVLVFCLQKQLPAAATTHLVKGSLIKTEEDIYIEQKYTYYVGIIMSLMALILLVNSLETMIEGGTPIYDNALTIRFSQLASSLGALFAFVLAFYKYYVAIVIESSLLLADAMSSFCAGLASIVAIFVSMFSLLWWMDGVAGTIVALYTLYSACITMMNAKVSDILLSLFFKCVCL